LQTAQLPSKYNRHLPRTLHLLATVVMRTVPAYFAADFQNTRRQLRDFCLPGPVVGSYFQYNHNGTLFIKES
jgi:hypothetical protein